MLDQVHMAIKCNRAIDMLYDPMTWVGHPCEGIAHKDACCLKKSMSALHLGRWPLHNGHRP